MDLPRSELGTRTDLENGIRKFLFIIAIAVCPLVAGGLLQDYIPTVVGRAIGGAIGGLAAYLIAEGSLRLLRLLSPPQMQLAAADDS